MANFVVLRHSVTVLVTVFTDPDNLINDLRCACKSPKKFKSHYCLKPRNDSIINKIQKFIPVQQMSILKIREHLK